MPEKVEVCSYQPIAAHIPKSIRNTGAIMSKDIGANQSNPRTAAAVASAAYVVKEKDGSKRSAPEEEEEAGNSVDGSVQKKPGAPPLPKIARSMSMSISGGYNPPDNFAHVCGTVYRSSYPKVENFAYLKKLGLKTILTLVPEEYPAENVQFLKQNGITHVQIPMPGNKEPFVNIPDDAISDALKVVMDRRNHPVLVHCNKGKHRTGCVIGCLRKFQGWSLTLIFDEYRRFAGIKARPLDQLKIELYKESACWNFAKDHGWIPSSLLPQEGKAEDDTKPPLTRTGLAVIKAQ